MPTTFTFRMWPQSEDDLAKIKALIGTAQIVGLLDGTTKLGIIRSVEPSSDQISGYMVSVEIPDFVIHA